MMLTKTVQMYSLAILMKYFLKENRLPNRVMGGLVTTFIWWVIFLFYNTLSAAI